MFDIAVGDDDSGIRKLHRRIFVMQGVGVQEDRTVLFAHGGGELIHDSAVHAVEIVLGILADQRQVHHGDSESEGVGKHQPGEHLQGGRRGKSAACGDISIEQDVGAPVQMITSLFKCPHDSLGIVGPACRVRRGQVAKGGLHNAHAVKIHGVETKLSVLSRTDDPVGTDGQCAREYVTAVVVGVFSDKVDASRCEVSFCFAAAAEQCRKPFFQF